MPREQAVVLGQDRSGGAEKKVGDPIQIETEELTVVGIVDGGAARGERLRHPFPAAAAGNHSATKDKINIIDVRVTPGTTEAQIARLCDQINGARPGSPRDAGAANTFRAQPGLTA